jgi:transcription elongation factor
MQHLDLLWCSHFRSHKNRIASRNRNNKNQEETTTKKQPQGPVTMVTRIAFQPGDCVMVYWGQWCGKVGWVTGVTLEFVWIALNVGGVGALALRGCLFDC